MAERRKVIKARKLTQSKAAKTLKVSPSRVSDLMTGKWEKFSLEMLITLATRAGLHVSLKTAAQESGLKRSVTSGKSGSAPLFPWPLAPWLGTVYPAQKETTERTDDCDDGVAMGLSRDG